MHNSIKYVHTNIISKDWRRLADFYITVFGCVEVPPERDLQGEWLSRGAGVTNAHLIGMHLRLPGYGDTGPSLEIYTYSEVVEAEKPVANRQGFGHIAFLVDDVAAVMDNAFANGGSKVGDVTQHPVPGVGLLTFTYIADPDGNIIELQNWK